MTDQATTQILAKGHLADALEQITGEKDREYISDCAAQLYKLSTRVQASADLYASNEWMSTEWFWSIVRDGMYAIGWHSGKAPDSELTA